MRRTMGAAIQQKLKRVSSDQGRTISFLGRV